MNRKEDYKMDNHNRLRVTRPHNKQKFGCFICLGIHVHALVLKKGTSQGFLLSGLGG